MSTKSRAIRVTLFLTALSIAALDWGARPVSSEAEGDGGFRSYIVSQSAPGGSPLSPTSPGHVDDYAVFRQSPVSGYIAVEDKIVFTQDLSAGAGDAEGDAVLDVNKNGVVIGELGDVFLAILNSDLVKDHGVCSPDAPA